MGYIFDALRKADLPDPPPFPRPSEELVHAIQSRTTAAPRVETIPTQFTDEQLRQSTVGIDERLVTLLEPSCPLTEEYRGIRTRLIASAGKSHVIHTITSSMPGEGRTLTSLNLAAVFGELSHENTLVIEGDLRTPSFQSMLRWPTGPGLLQLLRGEATLTQCLSPLRSSNLLVMRSGGDASNEAIQLLSSPRMAELLEMVRERFTQTIIDTPPVLDYADAGVIGSRTDQVILVVRMNSTPRDLVDDAMLRLEGYKAPASGVVLTAAAPLRPRLRRREADRSRARNATQ